MAKSKIIKELANGEVSLHVALKRAKILLKEFNNDALTKWVEQELTGYTDVASIPAYRITRGSLRGTYIRHLPRTQTTYKQVSIPVGKMPADLVEEMLRMYFCEGTEELAHLLDSGNTKPLVKHIPADLYPTIAKYNLPMLMEIVTADVETSAASIQGVLSTIESKLLDMFYYLEKQFGILDELDIDVDSKTAEEQKDIINHIYVLIYNDRSVTIGDNNKIKETTIASTIE